MRARAPSEHLGALLEQEHVCHHSRAPPIAVGKRVDVSQLVVKTCRLLIERIAAELPPGTHVVEQLQKLHGNLVWSDTDVALGTAKLTRPLPDVVEHALMKASQEGFAGHVNAHSQDLPSRPPHATQDVEGLRVVQILPGGNPTRLQPT